MKELKTVRISRRNLGLYFPVHGASEQEQSVHHLTNIRQMYHHLSYVRHLHDRHFLMMSAHSCRDQRGRFHLQIALEQLEPANKTPNSIKESCICHFISSKIDNNVQLFNIFLKQKRDVQRNKQLTNITSFFF